MNEASSCEARPRAPGSVPIGEPTTPENTVRLIGPVYIFGVIVAAPLVKVPGARHEDVREAAQATLAKYGRQLSCGKHSGRGGDRAGEASCIRLMTEVAGESIVEDNSA